MLGGDHIRSQVEGNSGKDRIAERRRQLGLVLQKRREDAVLVCVKLREIAGQPT